MPLREFTGTLDAPTLRPFEGELDAPGATDFTGELDSASDVGRAQTAAGEFVRGAGAVAAAVPKSLAIGSNQQPYAQRALSIFDRIDRGEEIPSDEVDEVSKLSPWGRAELSIYKKFPRNRERLRKTYARVAATRVQDTPLYQSGKSIDEYMGSLIETNPAYRDEFLAGQLPRGLGSTLTFALGAVATRGNPATVMGMGAAAGGANTFEDAIAKGASIEDATTASRYSAAIGTSEVLPIARLLDRVDKGSGGAIKRALINAMKSGTEEAIQELGQQIGDNLVASKIVKYDPDRGVFQGAGDASGVGFTSGALVSFLASAVGGRRVRTRSEPTPEATPPGGQQETAPGIREFTGDLDQAPAGQVREFTGKLDPADVSQVPRGTQEGSTDAAEATPLPPEQELAQLDDLIGTLEDEYARRPADGRASIGADLEELRAAREEVRAQIKPAAPTKIDATEIPRSGNLNDESRAIEGRFAEQIAGDVDTAIGEYQKRFGNVINTDNARELSADYAANDAARAKYSPAVHEPASWLAKEIYRRELAKPAPEGKENLVAFTAGGTGAGKTTAMNRVLSDKLLAAQIIYDTNMNGVKSSAQKIDQALAAGKKVEVFYIYRDPIEALVAGALPRAMKRGRTVELVAHAETHKGSLEAIPALMERYKGNQNVAFAVINNSAPGGAQVVESFDLLGATQYNDLDASLREALEQEYASGRISQAVYEGTRGQLQREAAREGRRGRDGGSAQVEESREGQAQEVTRQPIAVTRGDARQIYTAQGDAIAVELGIVEADSLITSHDQNGRENPAYPQEVQPRDRSRQSSQLQIAEISRNLKPELLGDTGKASDGAPIIGNDGVVESGNARTLALVRAYRDGNANKYRAWLEQNADSFGLDPAAVRAMAAPVLVRVRTTDVNRAEFARQANQADIAPMAAGEQAAADADRINELELQLFDPSEDGNVLAASNDRFLRRFAGRLGELEAGGLKTADGRWTKQMADRVTNAIFHKAYEDERLTALRAEEADPEIKNILAGLTIAAPAFAKARQHGRLGSLDVVSPLVDAIDMVRDAKARGLRVQELVDQTDMFKRPDPKVSKIALFLEANKRSSRRTGLMLRGVAEGIDRELAARKTARLFGEETTLEQIVEQAGDKVRQEYGEEDYARTGTLFANPIGVVLKGYQRLAQRALDFAYKKVGYKLSALKDLPAQDTYLTGYYRLLGRLAAVDEVAKKVYGTFAKASETDQQAVYAYLTSKNTPASVIQDRAIRERAIATKRLIDRVGQSLVRHKLLSPQAMDAHRHEYLPRVYLKYMLGEKAIAALGRGLKPGDMGYLKARQDIPQQVRELILGEIKDPGYLASRALGIPMRDMAIMDFFATIASKQEWVFPQSLVTYQGQPVSVYWLQAEAKRLLEQSNYMKDGPAQRTRAIARAMQQIATPRLAALGKVPDNFKQIPDTARYGAMRGIYVRAEIANQILGIRPSVPDDASIAQKLLGFGGWLSKATQAWKVSKVSLNPPAQIRNAASNAVLLHLSGVPLPMVPLRMAQAIRSIRGNGKHWRIARKYGVTESTFAGQEFLRIERQMLDTLARQDKAFGLADLKALAGSIVRIAGDTYSLVEAMYKTAKIIDAMEREGKSEQQAALDAQEALFDYSLVPQSVRYLRSAPIGVPFLTFYYKVTPLLLKTAALRPWAFLPYLAIPYFIQAMIADDYDVDKEDLDKLKVALPEWLRERGHTMFVPWKDENGRWQALDYGYFMPWSMHAELYNESSAMLKKQRLDGAGDLLNTTGILGGPVPNIITAIQANKDPFTRRQIADPADPPAHQLAAWTGYMWRLGAPTWLTDIGAAGHLYRSITGHVNPKRGPQYGEETNTTGQALARLFGINVYPIDPEASVADNLRRMRFELDDTKQRMRQRLRDPNLNDSQRDNLRADFEAEMTARRLQLEAYRDAADFNPKLLGQPTGDGNNDEPRA